VAYELLTYSELSARFSSLRQAPLGDRRAPHKPLLILLMLGRYENGNFVPITFEEARVKLSELLSDLVRHQPDNPTCSISFGAFNYADALEPVTGTLIPRLRERAGCAVRLHVRQTRKRSEKGYT
jgi:hypothetical protein